MSVCLSIRLSQKPIWPKIYGLSDISLSESAYCLSKLCLLIIMPINHKAYKLSDLPSWLLSLLACFSHDSISMLYLAISCHLILCETIQLIWDCVADCFQLFMPHKVWATICVESLLADRFCNSKMPSIGRYCKQNECSQDQFFQQNNHPALGHGQFLSDDNKLSAILLFDIMLCCILERYFGLILLI